MSKLGSSVNVNWVALNCWSLWHDFEEQHCSLVSLIMFVVRLFRVKNDISEFRVMVMRLESRSLGQAWLRICPCCLHLVLRQTSMFRLESGWSLDSCWMTPKGGVATQLCFAISYRQNCGATTLSCAVDWQCDSVATRRLLWFWINLTRHAAEFQESVDHELRELMFFAPKPKPSNYVKLKQRPERMVTVPQTQPDWKCGNSKTLCYFTVEAHVNNHFDFWSLLEFRHVSFVCVLKTSKSELWSLFVFP